MFGEHRLVAVARTASCGLQRLVEDVGEEVVDAPLPEVNRPGQAGGGDALKIGLVILIESDDLLDGAFNVVRTAYANHRRGEEVGFHRRIAIVDGQRVGGIGLHDLLGGIAGHRRVLKGDIELVAAAEGEFVGDGPSDIV